MFLKIKVVFIIISLQFITISLFSQNSVVYIDTAKTEMYQVGDLDTVYKQFKNTSINLKLPKYFIEFESDDISGFMNTGIAASIVGFEYNNTPYVGYYDAFAEKASSQVDNGVFLGKKESKTLAGQPAVFYFYSFMLKDIKINRIIFYTGDDKQMVFLQANYPAAYDALIREVIIQSFLTVEYKSTLR